MRARARKQAKGKTMRTGPIVLLPVLTIEALQEYYPRLT